MAVFTLDVSSWSRCNWHSECVFATCDSDVAADFRDCFTIDCTHTKQFSINCPSNFLLNKKQTVSLHLKLHLCKSHLYGGCNVSSESRVQHNNRFSWHAVMREHIAASVCTHTLFHVLPTAYRVNSFVVGHLVIHEHTRRQLLINSWPHSAFHKYRTTWTQDFLIDLPYPVLRLIFCVYHTYMYIIKIKVELTSNTYLLQHVTWWLPRDAFQAKKSNREAERQMVAETGVHGVHVKHVIPTPFWRWWEGCLATHHITPTAMTET